MHRWWQCRHRSYDHNAYSQTQKDFVINRLWSHAGASSHPLFDIVWSFFNQIIYQYLPRATMSRCPWWPDRAESFNLKENLFKPQIFPQLQIKSNRIMYCLLSQSGQNTPNYMHTKKASCRWQTRATLAKRLHGLCKSSGVVSCIADLPIDSLPMLSCYRPIVTLRVRRVKCTVFAQYRLWQTDGRTDRQTDTSLSQRPR